MIVTQITINKWLTGIIMYVKRKKQS